MEDSVSIVRRATYACHNGFNGRVSQSVSQCGNMRRRCRCPMGNDALRAFTRSVGRTARRAICSFASSFHPPDPRCISFGRFFAGLEFQVIHIQPRLRTRPFNSISRQICDLVQIVLAKTIRQDDATDEATGMGKSVSRGEKQKPEASFLVECVLKCTGFDLTIRWSISGRCETHATKKLASVF